MKARSKKSSSISARQPKCPVIFIDRTFGAYELASRLVKMGFKRVEVHDKHFKQREDDAVWIEKVGRKNWRILTQDKDLETRHHEAIVRGNAGIFILSDVGDDEGCDKWEEMIATCRTRLVHAAIHGNRPFVGRISYGGKLYRVHHLMPHKKTIDITLATEDHAASVGMSAS